MANYSDKAQPYLNAIANAVFTSQAARDWLIAGTPAEIGYKRADALFDEQRSVRGPTKQPFWANYFCGRDRRCTCRIDGSRSLESDAIFFLRNRAGRVLAIHLEFKHPKEQFGFGQPEGYPLRAGCFARTHHQRSTINEHHDWITVLFCGPELLSDRRLSNFNRVITHKEARQNIPGYPNGSAFGAFWKSEPKMPHRGWDPHPTRDALSPVEKRSSSFIISDSARRIARERTKFWEFELTVDLLRTNVDPIADRWHRLRQQSQGSDPWILVPGDVPGWCQARFNELQSLYAECASLLHDRLRDAWGPPGVPGDAEKIETVCKDLTALCERALHWEERIKCAPFPDVFLEVQRLLLGHAGMLLDEIGKISIEMAHVIGAKEVGTHQIDLTVKFPTNWEEKFLLAITQAMESAGSASPNDKSKPF